MAALTIQDEIQRIENDYFANEEDKAAAIAALNELHHKAWGNPEAEQEFRGEAILIAGGAYIPYILWPELARFLAHQDNRALIADIFQAIVNSDFDEELQDQLKPFLIIFFAKEKVFELDKLRSFIIDKGHPLVKEYFEKLVAFVQKNPQAVATYQKKFALVQDRYPDFELFNLPATRLEEELA